MHRCFIISFIHVLDEHIKMRRLGYLSCIQFWFYPSTALQPFGGPWLLFSFLILNTVGRISWTRDQPLQGCYLHIEQHKRKINAHIHVLSGFPIRGPGIRTAEDDLFFRQCSQCDRHNILVRKPQSKILFVRF
jgi:hypothetical protein